jgi:serine/threonine protein kinase
LIFKDNTGAYTARVTDFGYSTQFANEDDLLSVPKSWPWYAPEHNRDKFKPAQAQKMDVFSFGMLCFWILFEKYLSGITLLPREAQWAEKYFQGKEKRHLCKWILADCKRDDKLVVLAQQLAQSERDIDIGRKQALERLLSTSLACNPDERAKELRELLTHCGLIK